MVYKTLKTILIAILSALSVAALLWYGIAAPSVLIGNTINAWKEGRQGWFYIVVALGLTFISGIVLSLLAFAIRRVLGRKDGGAEGRADVEKTAAARKGRAAFIAASALLAVAAVAWYWIGVPSIFFTNVVTDIKIGYGGWVLAATAAFAAFSVGIIVSIVFVSSRGRFSSPRLAGRFTRNSGRGDGAGWREPRPAGRFERGLLRALGVIYVVMCASGFLQYPAFHLYGVYQKAIFIHKLSGIAAGLLFFFEVFLYSRRHYSFVPVVLLTAYPLLYVVLLLSPSPLLISWLIVGCGVFPASMYFLVRRETPPEGRARLAVAAAAYYGFLLALLTGLTPLIDPIMLRFSFRHRIVHAFLAPGAVLLPRYFILLERRLRGRVGGYEKKHAYAIAGLFALCLAIGGGLHAAKRGMIRAGQRDNSYPSPAMAKEAGAEFRVMAPWMLSGDKFCGRCHAITFRQWEVSAHANSARTKTFQSIAADLVKKHGLKIAEQCAPCHDPEVAFLNRPELLLSPAHVKRSQGVSCRACHYMSSAGGKNAVYSLDIPRTDLEPVSDRTRARLVLGSVVEHVDDVTKRITKDGTMCYPCHSLESQRRGHTLVPLDNVSSFVGSSFAKRMPCHRCHMPRIEQDERTYSWMDHAFFGIQQELPAVILYADKGLLKRAEKFTADTGLWLEGKLPALNLLEAGMDETFKSYRINNYSRTVQELRDTIDAASGGRHFVMKLEEFRRGAAATITLSTASRNIAHDFPSTLFANISDVWFELLITDAAGREVYSSGLEPDNFEHQLARIEVDAAGKAIEPEDSLGYADIVNKKYIVPGKKYIEHYNAPLGRDVRFPLEARYRLMYRRYDDSVIRRASGNSVRSVPKRIVAEDTFIINK